MDGTISLVALQLGLFAFFSVKCGAIYLVLRKETAIAWITGALMLGVVYTLVASLWPTDLAEQLASVLATPLAFFCIASSIRLLSNQPPPSARFWLAIAGINLAVAAALVAGIDYFLPMALFQLSVAAAALRCFQLVRRARPRHLLDGPAMAVLAALAVVFLARVPLWLAGAPLGASYRAVRALPADSFVFAASSSLSALLALLLVARGLTDLYRDLRHRADRDGLTGLYNRTAFARAVGDTPGVLLLADIDHFKTINDRHGHAVGDQVIRAFAALLADTGALAARVGGEEFALWLPGGCPADARELAERVRRKFQSRSFAGLSEDERLTASFGLSLVDEGEALGVAFHRADAALYRAKDGGRDRVELCPVALGRLAA